MTQLSLGGLGGIVLAPDVLEEQRGAWCSPPEWCERAMAGKPFDVDPFTNPRSTLEALLKCMLERGDDGFGLDKRSEVGAFYINPENCSQCQGTGCVVDPDRIATAEVESDALVDCDACGYHIADENTRLWFQPPYDIVIEALQHYGHTRFVALLRLDTSTVWFTMLWQLAEVIMVPRRDRLDFVPPPGVKASSNPFPHGLYYRRAADVPQSVIEHCYPWPCPGYPWAEDPLKILSGIRVRWRMFEHKVQPIAGKHGRGTLGMHLVGVDDGSHSPVCGDYTPQIVTYEEHSLRGMLLACSQCMAISERLPVVTAVR